MTRVYLRGVGVVGPGLIGWAGTRAALTEGPYTPADARIPPLDVLPAAERRRTGVPVKLALTVGLEALSHAAQNAATVASVFTSSGADGQVIHDLCETLAGSDRQISPTRFHNSVHNAAAGYWSIATGARAPSTSLCCHDFSFVAGLLEAATQTCLEHQDVLLVAYDLPYPAPLNAARAITGMFAVALLLARTPRPETLAALDVSFDGGAAPTTTMEDPNLETLRAGNPSARSLPILRNLACRRTASVSLDYLNDSHVQVAVTSR